MNCPKCNNPMATVKRDGVEIDRCESCKGLWFDAFEERALRDAKAAAGLDTGSPRVGEKWDGTGKVRCPRCESPMVRMVDRDQPHIWYEQCSTCHGRFFDAGEFLDLSEKTISEFFSRNRKGERPLN